MCTCTLVAMIRDHKKNVYAKCVDTSSKLNKRERERERSYVYIATKISGTIPTKDPKM